MTPWKGEVPGDLGGILDRTMDIWVLRLYWEHLFVVPLLGCYYVMPRNPDRIPAPVAVPKKMVPPQSLSYPRPSLNFRYPCDMSQRLSPPSCLRWYVAHTCQTDPSRHPEPPAGGLFGARRGAHHWRKITTPVIGPPV